MEAILQLSRRLTLLLMKGLTRCIKMYLTSSTSSVSISIKQAIKRSEGAQLKQTKARVLNVERGEDPGDAARI